MMVKRLQAAHKQILSVCSSGTSLEPLIVESRFPNENRTCPITIKADWLTNCESAEHAILLARWN